MARDLQYEPSKEILKRIENDFSYHPPKDNQYERYEQIRDKAKKFAKFLVESCPESRELSLALTHMEQAIFYSNASIARHE
jgi:hypothetical protein